jgi:hypothetical protein
MDEAELLQTIEEVVADPPSSALLTVSVLVAQVPPRHANTLIKELVVLFPPAAHNLAHLKRARGSVDLAGAKLLEVSMSL